METQIALLLVDIKYLLILANVILTIILIGVIKISWDTDKL